MDPLDKLIAKEIIPELSAIPIKLTIVATKQENPRIFIHFFSFLKVEETAKKKAKRWKCIKRPIILSWLDQKLVDGSTLKTVLKIKDMINSNKIKVTGFNFGL